jgi:hypothetical protein
MTTTHASRAVRPSGHTRRTGSVVGAGRGVGRHGAPPPVTEKDFMGQVLQIARLYRWHAYHPALSKWSERGWPDIALCRPPRLVFAELKAEAGKVTEHQERWLGLLRACPGVEVFLWRPSDLERVASVL